MTSPTYFRGSHGVSWTMCRRMIPILVSVIGISAVCECGVLPRPPNTEANDSRDPPVTSSDLPKQIPAPPRPRSNFASTPHYEQQLPRLFWVTPHYTRHYPVVQV